MVVGNTGLEKPSNIRLYEKEMRCWTHVGMTLEMIMKLGVAAFGLLSFYY